MTHASLFSGIGGPEIAAAMLGWDNLFHCEINPFGRAVLDYWFPNSKSYEDITKTDFTEWRGKVDVLTGGFPCQPFSYAGQRRGAEDDRYLWPQMLRAIEECRPTYVIGENVAGITTMVEPGEIAEVGVQTSLFGEEDTLRTYELRQRFTIERVCSDLESIGYSVQPFIIPACAVGAPHRRDRVFIIAYSNERDAVRVSGEIQSAEGAQRLSKRDNIREFGESDYVRPESDGPSPDSCGNGLDGVKRTAWSERTLRSEREDGAHVPCAGHGMDIHTDIERIGEHGPAPDTESEQGHGCEPNTRSRAKESLQFGGGGRKDGAMPTAYSGSAGLERSATERIQGGAGRGTFDFVRECTRCSGEGGAGERYRGWTRFPTVSPIHRGNDGLSFDVDDLSISFAQWRTESLKAYGNAIVPQVMLEIFRAIEEITPTSAI